MALIKLLGVMVFFMVLAEVMVTDVQADIDCNSVENELLPCISFLQNGNEASLACCNGVKSVNNTAITTIGRQQTCRCLQNAANQFPGINPKNAAELPDKCGVRIPFTIGPSTDCSKVK
ncbi:hypothetical protein K2173_014977 [Erythroxylum novogranatense]|uniref:Non-specific lipid-transfer protein n=1 Tax=Erythroxylum novogranatense TaxID=1862640 RepID=A0AAV8TWD4_9ROSI|nr:hypothetical protein K2173_014977 [Erythroxylum novogranatense]